MPKIKHKTIGQIIHPSWNYDIEASLRVHQLLIRRATDEQWRITGRITTGPYETLCGRGGTGSSITKVPSGQLQLRLELESLDQIVAKVNGTILRALCEYPGFGSLDETIRIPFVHCGHAIADIAKFEGGRTIQQLNNSHPEASLVKEISLYSGATGVYADVKISFNNRPTEAAWSMYYLLREKHPEWRMRERLATFLKRLHCNLSIHVTLRTD